MLFGIVVHHVDVASVSKTAGSDVDLTLTGSGFASMDTMAVLLGAVSLEIQAGLTDTVMVVRIAEADLINLSVGLMTLSVADARFYMPLEVVA